MATQLLYFAIECISVLLSHDEGLAYFVFYSVSSNPHHDKMIGMIGIVFSTCKRCIAALDFRNTKQKRFVWFAHCEARRAWLARLRAVVAVRRCT